MTVLDDPHRTLVDGECATALLDAMTDATAVLRRDGVIVAVNRAWRMFCLDNDGDPESVGTGVNYLEVCERAAAKGCADAQVALTGLRAVLAGEAVERTLDYACSSPTVVRWFMLRIVPVRHGELGALVTHTNITRRKTSEQSMTAGRHVDPVTRLPGREQLASWLQRGPAEGPEAVAAGETGVLYIHVEGMPWVADTYGETARDEVLQTIAQRLTAVIRRGDGIAHLGEHEFAVAAPGMTATGLTGLLARIRHALGEAVSVQGQSVELGATVGTYLASPGEDLTNCLRLADESSYPIRRALHPGERSAPPLGAAMAGDHRAAGTADEPRPVMALERPAASGDRSRETDAGTEPPTKGRRTTDLPDRAPRPEDGLAADRRLQELSVALERALAERTTELQLRAGELTAAKEELQNFAYSVSHDLRAPLRAMSGFARILVEDHSGDLDAEAQHCLERIQASAEEMGHQIDGLLTVSRLQRRRLSHVPLDMWATARKAWEQVKPADRSIHFHVADLPDAHGDQELIAELIRHLLDNAVKFTARVDEPRIEVSADAADGSVVYVVEDNGVGFDMRCANRLFRPFQRMHPAHDYPGIGIGLAVAQQIVRLHGGTIDAQAAPGEGARFRFTLGPPTAV